MEVISLLLSNCINYFILFTYLNDKYNARIVIKKQILFIIGLIIAITMVNLLNIPPLNLITAAFSYVLMGYIIFEYHTMKEYVSDFNFLIIIILFESLCFYIANIILSNITLANNIYITLVLSIILFFFSSIIKRNTRGLSLKNVSIYGLIIFLSTTFFNIFLLCIFAYVHNIIDSMFYQGVFIIASIGIVIINIVIISCFQIINKSYETKKELMNEKNQNDRLLQHYNDINKSFDITQGLIHDFRNHFQIVTLAYEQGEKELAKKTIDNYLNEIDKNRITFSTNRPILDIVLYEKNNDATKHGIQFNYKMNDIDLSFIEDFEIITLFGNLLDNCIEANYEISKVDKFISVLIFEIDGMLIIKIENSCNNELVIVNNEIKTTKKVNDLKRGQGIKNIKKVVDKVDGNFDMNIKDCVCTTIISIPVTVN